LINEAHTAGVDGHHVVLATDAMTDRKAGAHHNSVEQIFPRIGPRSPLTGRRPARWCALRL
jgi:hypothetical protein